MSRSLEHKVYNLENCPVTVIELTGQIDSSRALEPIEEIAVGSDIRHVLLDMKEITYINSRGCGGLIAMHHKVEDRGYHLFVIGAAGGVAKVIRQVGCHKILHIRKSIDEVIHEIEV